MRCRDLPRRSVAKKVCASVSGAFHGLCLDCMKISTTGDPDADYWMHHQLRQWSSGCRVYHTQPSWYFSHMGRNEVMNEYQETKKARKRSVRGELVLRIGGCRSFKQKVQSCGTRF